MQSAVLLVLQLYDVHITEKQSGVIWSMSNICQNCRISVRIVEYLSEV